MPSVTNPMQQAAYRGCVECLRMLVESPPYYSVDASCGTDGLRPIHIAAKEGHIQTLRFLSTAGACLQKVDSGGCTALHHAAAGQQVRSVRWLLRHGAKILLDKRGRSPIQVAADHDCMEIVNILAKHATSVPTTGLNSKDSNNSEIRTTRRPSGQTSDKDTSDFTTGSVGDYSFSESINSRENNQPPQQTQNSTPFSHLHLGSDPAKISTSPATDCASSSGNSSLSASTSAPSLSPSSSSAVSCGCSTSDETTLVKSVADVSDAFTLEEYQTSDSYQSENSLVASPGPFYLHPPSSKDYTLNSPRIDYGTTVECGKGILKKSNHKRQGSTVQTSNSPPFYLHPPENLVSETQKVVVGKMAPVNSSHPHLHFADPSHHDSTPKLKIGLAESSSSSSSTSSPPQTPPGTKNGMSSTISECISKFQTDGSKRENSHSIHNKSSDINLKNQINSNNGSIPPPPPPPPPLPSMALKPSANAQKTLPNLPTESPGHTCQQNGNDETENDYEDIEEFAANKNQYEQTRKLLRSVSSPPPTNEISHAGVCGEKTEEKSSHHSNGLTSERTGTNSKPPVGCGKSGVPFIPPHFPTPPQDALIKPSEYLRSIQNKSKPNGSQNGILQRSSSSRVEETMKALQIHDNHTGLMSPVPEETNAEDEFEEINPERINGFIEINANEIEPSHSTNSGPNHENKTDENNNNSASTIRGGCGGIIKAEELMKVNLRKTPMSRTKSAPPLGRVIPDNVEEKTQSQIDKVFPNNENNGHEPLKRASTMSPTCLGDSEGDASKANVIAELAQSSQVGGVREWKEILKRRQKEQEKAVRKEIEQFYQSVNFVSEVPSTDLTGAPIPDWKRQMMAKKAAERAKKEAEEQRRLEIEAKRQASIPMWRRQLLQRRGSDAKYAQ